MNSTVLLSTKLANTVCVGCGSRCLILHFPRFFSLCIAILNKYGLDASVWTAMLSFETKESLCILEPLVIRNFLSPLNITDSTSSYIHSFSVIVEIFSILIVDKNRIKKEISICIVSDNLYPNLEYNLEYYIYISLRLNLSQLL